MPVTDPIAQPGNLDRYERARRELLGSPEQQREQGELTVAGVVSDVGIFFGAWGLIVVVLAFGAVAVRRVLRRKKESH